MDDRCQGMLLRPGHMSFNNWLQAFCIYASVMAERFPEKYSGRFQHIVIILEAYKNFRGFTWFHTMRIFGKKLFSSLRWGSKDVGLSLNLKGHVLYV